MTGAPSCRKLAATALLSVLLAGAGSGSFAQTTAEKTDDLTAIGRIVGTDINKVAAVVRYHSAILMTRMEQFESAYEALQQFVYQNNTSPKVVEALGLSILRMRYLPSEYPPAKRELVMLAGRAAYETAARRAENADRLYQELVSRYPDEATVHYAYGAFLMGSKPDLAVQQFQQELKKNPDHVPSLLQIAMEYLRQGRYQEALPLAERAHRLLPNFFTSRKVLGRVLLETGQIERAVQELEAGVQLKPEDSEMHFALSRAYARAGRKAEAERARREFLRLDRIYRSQREGPAVRWRADAALTPPAIKDGLDSEEAPWPKTVFPGYSILTPSLKYCRNGIVNVKRWGARESSGTAARVRKRRQNGSSNFLNRTPVSIGPRRLLPRSLPYWKSPCEVELAVFSQEKGSVTNRSRTMGASWFTATRCLSGKYGAMILEKDFVSRGILWPTSGRG